MAWCEKGYNLVDGEWVRCDNCSQLKRNDQPPASR